MEPFTRSHVTDLEGHALYYIEVWFRGSLTGTCMRLMVYCQRDSLWYYGTDKSFFQLTLLKSCSQSVLCDIWNIFMSSWSAVKDLPLPDNPPNTNTLGSLEFERSASSLSASLRRTTWVGGPAGSYELINSSIFPTQVWKGVKNGPNIMGMARLHLLWLAQHGTYIVVATIEPLLEGLENGLYCERATDIDQIKAVSFLLTRHNSN